MLKKLTVFIPSLYIGGAQRIAIEIANRISDHGENVELLIGSDKKEIFDIVNPEVSVNFLNSKRTFLSLFRLIKYFKKNSPEVFFSTQPHGTIVAWLASKIARWNGKFVARETNTLKFGYERKWSIKEKIVIYLVKKIYTKIDAVIVSSSGFASELAGNVKIIPNLINISDVISKSNKEIKIKGNFILAVGRLVKQKRFQDLIKAFSKIEKNYATNLVILGDGPEKKKLIKLTEELKVADKTHFLGYDTNPFKYMSKCDVFVLTSGWEGMPNVLLQAMACGAKIVSTDCKHGPREILKDGKFGELVSVGNVDEITNIFGINFFGHFSP